MNRTLRAGPLTLSLEEGGIRRVRFGGREVLRRIYGAVRDRNWNTAPTRVSSLEVEERSDSFRATFDASCVEGPIDFAWRAVIAGGPDGTITFRMEGDARSDFLRNRIGLCVLHPIRECAGNPCTVNGAAARFPRLVSPHQPFKEIRTIAHEVVPGLRAEVSLEGDVFEMEDQRNWTDASFKIYSTPLERPFPAQVRRGDRVSQAVTLRLEGRARPEISPVPLAFTLEEGPSIPFPALGVVLNRPLGPGDLDRLRPLRLSHLRVDLDPAHPDAPVTLARAWDSARAIGARLEIAAHAAGAEDLRRLSGMLAETRAEVSAVLLFREVPGARAALPGVRIAGGTDAYLAELNRRRPPAGLDLVCFSSNPQVHQSDDLTLVENLEGLAEAVATALTFGSPVAVTPVTLRPRFNPNATSEDPEPSPDPRQRDPFGAAWTVGALRHLAGASSATFYEAAGPRGLFEGDALFPVYGVLADVVGAETVVPTRSSDPLRVDGLAFRRKGRTRVLLANLTGEPQRVETQGEALDLAPYEVRTR